jgi:hypothetical protein
MLQGSGSQHELTKMTNTGLAFLTASIVIGMGFGAGRDHTVVAGVAMLVLLGIEGLSRAW